MTRAFWLPWATHKPAITFGEAALLRFSKAKDMLSSVRGAVGMTSPLLGNLITGAGSSSQLVGGLVIVLLYAVIGTLSAIGSILVFRRMFQGRWEQVFWASFLAVIAAFYLSFAAYFGAAAQVWQTELGGVAVFVVFAVAGLFSRPLIAIGYVLHGLWDLSHCLSGSSVAGLQAAELPLGYGIFCASFDIVVACYLMLSNSAWEKPGKFEPYIWRHGL